jgi:hypothetical protein
MIIASLLYFNKRIGYGNKCKGEWTYGMFHGIGCCFFALLVKL